MTSEHRPARPILFLAGGLAAAGCLAMASAWGTAAGPRESRVAMPHEAQAGAWTEPATVSFNRDIRPILVKNCLACHGDPKKLEGNVLLKSFADATGASGFEPVIIPGDAAASPLIRRVTAPHIEQRMPPPESKKQLTAQEIALLRDWINAGARYEQHWSYISPQRPEVPASGDPWVRNPIDAFVLQKMRAYGLSPAPVAEDRELVRRLYLDLNGLLPDYAEVEAAVGLRQNNARYGDLVEHLMSSTHYGERMALPWLDWVKYSDEISDHGDYYTTFYPYRNYVIRAFAENMPFDRFTREQLAGDLLDQPTPDQLIASGYNHLIVRVQDGVGVEAIHKYLTERVDKLGQVWLASSLECSQCHDHKFDPWKQKQYYQFAAFFADLDRIGVWTVGVSGSSISPRNADDAYFKLPRVYLPTAEQEQELAALDAQLADLRGQLEGAEFADRAAVITAELRADAQRYPDYYSWVEPKFSAMLALDASAESKLMTESARPPGGNGAIVTGDIQYLKLRDAEQAGRDFRIRFEVGHDKLSALMLRITKQGGETYSFGKPDEVAIREVEFSIERDGVLHPLKLADAESTDLGMMDEYRLIDGDPDTIWTLRPGDLAHKYRYERKDDLLLKTIHNEAFVVFTLAEPLLGAKGHTLQVDIRHRDQASRARSINLTYTPMRAASPFQKHAPGPVASSGIMRSLRQSLYNFVHERVFFTDFWDFTASQIFTWMATNAGVSAPVPFNDVMKSTLATVKERYAWDEIFRDHVVLRAPSMRDLGRRIRDLERRRERLWGEVARSWKSDTSSRGWPVRVLKNGQIADTSGERVGPGLPEFLRAPQISNPTRLDLADWLVSEDNPLTARAFVNRIWRLFMGRALVPTLEEFGSGGEQPTHPELLDWLATEFVASGWDVKHLVRLIVNSATYRQSSLPTPELEKLDPQNRWFARQSRFRIDAEFIQDAILKTAGLLQPGAYGEHTEHAGDSGLIDRDRRAIYLLRKNIEVQPELRAFGARPREKSVIHRPESITPIQALASLNQPLVMRAAGQLANALVTGELAPDAGLDMLYKRILQRLPSAEERAVFAASLAESLGGADRAFWTNQARTLLSLRETTLRS